ncbi:MAG: glycoside hydrolase family 30 beta sandwich domain-containing protein [Bacillota bacterium]
MNLNLVTTYYDSDNAKQSKVQDVKFAVDMEREDRLINLYPQMKYQTFSGFGGAITDSAGYIYSLMDEVQKKEMVTSYFTQKDMQYNTVRIPIDSCDFSLEHYEADSDPLDVDFTKFSFERVEKYIIPLLEDAERAYGGKLDVVLSPWSPPSFMKTNGERNNGGKLKPEFRKHWAEYICRTITEYRNRGYNVTKLTMQNEPKATQTWDSCVYTAEEMKAFLVDYMQVALEKNGLSDIAIYIWDHNKERAFEWAETMIDDTTDSMIAGLAFHWYSGDHFEALQMIKEKFPNKQLMMSEACIEYSKYEADNFLENAQKYAHDIIGDFLGGMNTFVDWNLILDEIGGPNHVGNFCDAPFLFDTKKKELIKRNIADHIWHFSHFLEVGAVRIGLSRFTDKLEVVAFEKDSKITFVILNRTEETLTTHIRVSDQCAEITILPLSISTGVIER